jgi:putative ABC transport system permease protein
LLLWLRLIKESIVFAWQAIVTNKLRTFLSLLGVMVGIFVITAVFTLVDTMESNLKDTFSMLSDDVLFVQRMPWGPEEGDEEYAWWKYMQRPQVKLSDMKALDERLTMADAVSFQIGGNATIERLNSNISAQLAAVTTRNAFPSTFLTAGTSPKWRWKVEETWP